FFKIFYNVMVWVAREYTDERPKIENFEEPQIQANYQFFLKRLIVSLNLRFFKIFNLWSFISILTCYTYHHIIEKFNMTQTFFSRKFHHIMCSIISTTL